MAPTQAPAIAAVAALLFAGGAASLLLPRAPEASVKDYYSSFEAPRLDNTTYSEVQKLLLQGRPFVVLDGARGLPMASWDCDFVKKEFPDSRIRQEGTDSDVNAVKMSSDWTSLVKPFKAAKRFPPGAPKNRPFYWDIAKASQDEKHRKWGKKPREVVQKIVSSSAVPYWLPNQETTSMGSSSEMWFHPPGAGAPAHMDPHCSTTVSFCFSGRRKWRMMVPPEEPHPSGYFDGEIYGASDPKRQGEWQPTFEVEAPAGSAVIVYPGMVHETVSTGEACSSSISQTFDVPVAAAYYRAFWPRFALIGEDVGNCGYVVSGMVTFNSRTRISPAKEEEARKAGKVFASKVDKDGDGKISAAEMEAIGGKASKKQPNRRSLEELVSFHDVDRDGEVTAKEVEESWVMYATAMHRVKSRPRQQEL